MEPPFFYLKIILYITNISNNMLINFEQTMNKLNDVRSGKFKEGLGLNVKGIDEYLRFKPGNFNVILGHANVGKTTVVLYLMLLYTLKHGIRWLVFSSENEAYSIIKKMIEFMEQKPINKIDQEVYKKQAAFINDHFKFVNCEDLFTFDKLLKLADDIKSAWDYKGFLIDPYNSLIKNREVLKGISSHEYDYEATSRLRMFCKNKNVTIWLNTHASTEALRKRHPKEDYYAGHPIPPMASDVEGGGKFVNRADDFFVIHRYIQHPQDWMQSHIHVRKVKDIDTGGRPTPMDEPIRLKSIKNNVGFEINGVNPLKPKTHEFKKEIPF